MTVAAIELEYAYRECEQITRREAANFYYGIRLLPAPSAEAMCAAYAFARRVDDIGDGGRDRDAQLQALREQRTMVWPRSPRTPPIADPVIAALAHARPHMRCPWTRLSC